MTDTMPPELTTDPPVADVHLEWLFDETASLAEDTGWAQPVDETVKTLADSEDGIRWHISSVGEAEWAMRHVAEADRNLRTLGEQRDEFVAQITAWYERESVRDEARRAFFAGHLERYALEQRASGGGKTVGLPSGDVKTRVSKAVAEIVDRATVVAWAEQHLSDAVEPQPAKLVVSGFRTATRIVEIVDAAQLILDTGEILEWNRTGITPEADWPEADIISEACPEPGPFEGSTIQTVLPTSGHDEVVDRDGNIVPGTAVRPETVTASVKVG